MLFWTLWKLGSSSPDTRRQALEALAAYNGFARTKVLLAVLERFWDGDASVAAQAGLTFAALIDRFPGLPAAERQALWDQLYHRLQYPNTDSDQRFAAMAARLHDPVVMGAFVRLVQEDMCQAKFRYASTASQLLVKSRNPEGLEPVLTFVEHVAAMDAKDDPQSNAYNNANVAIGFLGGSGQPGCFPRLQRILEGDGRTNVRERIVEALVKLDSQRAGPVLARVTACSDSKVSDAAARQLKLIDWKPTSPADQALLATVQGNWDAARQCGAEAVEPLLLVLQRPTHEQWIPALDVLRDVGDERAVPVIRSLIDDLGIYVQAVPKVFIAAGSPPPPGAKMGHFLEPLRESRAALGTRFPRLQYLDSYFCVKMVGVLDGSRIEPLIVHLMTLFVEKLVHAADALQGIGNRSTDPAIRAAAEEGRAAAVVNFTLLKG